MSEKRIKVWVQRFKDRPHLMLQWTDSDTGRRRSQSAETADPEKAEAARGDLEADLNNGRHQDTSRMSWERFRELFEAEHLPNVRAKTRGMFGVTLDCFEEICNPKNLRSITERTLSAFVAGMRTKKIRGGKVGLHPYTIQVRMQFFRAVLGWAAEQRLIPRRPKFPSVKAPKRKPQPVSTEAFERLLMKAEGDDQMRGLILCGWLAGLRLEEAVGLRWEPSDDAAHVDLERNRIVLPATMVKAAEDQWVPLDPELRKVLTALPRHGASVFRFLSKRTGKPMVTDAVGGRVAALAKAAGVKLTMRSLRRGFGCRYAGKVSSHVLQRLMRHSSITITMDYYANIDDAVEAAVLGTAGQERNDLRNGRRNSAGANDAASESDAVNR